MNNALDDADGSCGDATSGDVVYGFTIPAGSNQRARITASNAVGFDPVIYLRSGSCAGGEAGCAQSATGATEQVDLPDLAPGTYYVWVDAMGGVTAPGTFDVLLELLPAVAPPSNDTCAAPHVMTAGTLYTGLPQTSTVGSADDVELSCLTYDSRDNLHQFTTAAAQSVLVTATPLAPPWDLAAALRLHSGCSGTTDVSCVGDAFASRYILRPNLTAGQYDVVVDGESGAAGDYSIRYETRAADTTFGYWRIDTTGTFTPLDASDPTVPGFTAGGGSDEVTWPLTLPFDFDFYGNTYTAANINSNLFVTFQAVPAGAAAYGNDCALDNTTPNDMIAVLWDDGVPGSTATLRYRVEGAAPGRRVIIEFKDWDFVYCQGPSCYMQGMKVTQQLILYESGDIELRYGPRDNTGAQAKDCGLDRIRGCSATVGIENATGADIDSGPTCNVSFADDGDVIYWVHPR